MKIVTLCGSTKFKDEFKKVERNFASQGIAVFSCPFFSHTDGDQFTEEEIDNLNKLHNYKIRHSDEIYVINKDGYIGPSTQMEIALAELLGIPVHYLEDPKKETIDKAIVKEFWIREISLYDLTPSIASNLVRLLPIQRIENFAIIMDKIVNKCKEDFNKRQIIGTIVYTKDFIEAEFYDYISKITREIPEFVELNLSYNEIQQGIKVDDPNRAPFRVVNAYDKETEDSWKDDFMDLDAFVQNVVVEFFPNIKQ